MRLLARLALLLPLLLGHPRADASPLPVIGHDLRIVLNPAGGRLEGIDEVTVSPGKGIPDFRVAPRTRVTEVTSGGKPVPFTFRSGRLTVRAAQGTSSIRIVYTAEYRDPVPDDPVNTEDPSYGIAAAITAKGSFLGGGAGWYPEPEDALSTFRLRVEAPEGILAVTSGRRLENRTEKGKTVSVWAIDHPVRGLALAAGPYHVREAETGGIPVYTYFYPGSEELASTYLGAAVRYLELYRGRFGSYPFPKFAVVENFFPTGYGYPSWTLLGSAVVRLPFIVETSLGHEIAHSWWGNGVWVDYSRGNWSEGLTTYVADYLYKEMQSPEEAREYRLKILRDYAALVPPGKDIALKDFLSRTSAAEQAVGYGKGAMVFHMARQRIGDGAFWTGLRRVAESRMFQQTAWDDFARAFGKPGASDLGEFFRQWVNRPGAPVLSLEEVRRERTSRGWRVSGKVRQRPPLYDLNLPVRLETESGPVDRTVHSRSEVTPFTLESSGVPQRLAFDPGANLFRRLDVSEIPATVNGIRGSSSILVVASRTLPAETAEAARLLLTAMGKENLRLVPEGEVSREALRGKDVLFLGLPADASLLPALPPELMPGSESTILRGRAFAGAQSAVFAALPHPTEPGRVAALFLPGSAEAARQAGRKIPHYGKYSYLAFIEGTNVEKGIWPVTESPLIHSFEGSLTGRPK